MGYRVLEEAVSILRGIQLYVLRRRACGRLEKLGLAVRESWEARGFLQRGAGGDYHKRVEEYCLMDDEGEHIYRQHQMGLPSYGGWGRIFLESTMDIPAHRSRDKPDAWDDL
jgi:hypothetical protein